MENSSTYVLSHENNKSHRRIIVFIKNQFAFYYKKNDIDTANNWRRTVFGRFFLLNYTQSILRRLIFRAGSNNGQVGLSEQGPQESRSFFWGSIYVNIAFHHIMGGNHKYRYTCAVRYGYCLENKHAWKCGKKSSMVDTVWNNTFLYWKCFFLCTNVTYCCCDLLFFYEKMFWL